MRTALRCALLLAVLATVMPAVARAQTVCDQLLPIGVVSPAVDPVFGCANTYVLKRAGGTGTTPPLTYIALAYPPCANGACDGLSDILLFVCGVRSGYSCCISAPGTVPLMLGNMAGPLNQGLNQRFASDTDTLPGICFSNYRGNGARLVNVPMILPFVNGTTQVQVVGFARVFLVKRPSGNGDLLVEFVAEPTPTQGTTWGRAKIRYR
jgi:hypothetical protein